MSTAVSWLTILPVRGAEVFDTITGRRAMLALPVVGFLLGIPGALITAAGWMLGVPFLLTAVLVLAVWELGTRMMHIDGLADVGDALGSYAPPEKARDILADKYTGALGMGAVLITLLCSTAALSVAVAAGPRGMLVVLLIPCCARWAAMYACTARFSPISAGGFGGLVIGTVPKFGWWAWSAACALTVPAVGVMVTAPMSTMQPWVIAGVFGAAVVVALVLLVGFARHMQRRFHGLNGDCLGALIEVGTAIFGVVFALATVLCVR